MDMTEDPSKDLLRAIKELPASSPHEGELRAALIQVAENIVAVDDILMRIVDEDLYVSSAFKDRADRMVTHGMELFAKLAQRTEG